MRNHKENFLSVVAMFVMSTIFVMASGANAQAQKARAVVSTVPAATQQPPYSDYKGVRLGMTAQEARTKLGEPTLKSDEQDYFVFSDKETAQIGYDVAHRVNVISVDYMSGAVTPDPKAVVGSDLELEPNGSLYKIVRYENQGFWVSYNRTGRPGGHRDDYDSEDVVSRSSPEQPLIESAGAGRSVKLIAGNIKNFARIVRIATAAGGI